VRTTWSTTGALKTSRSFHTATDFGDGTGRVLVANKKENETNGKEKINQKPKLKKVAGMSRSGD